MLIMVIPENNNARKKYPKSQSNQKKRAGGFLR